MIQFNPEKKMVMVGDNFFPAMPFGKESCYPYCQGYRIPLGESGKYLSIAIGNGSYSDNQNNDFPVISDPMDVVEVGFDFGGERGFDVIGYQNDEELARIIILAMKNEDPF